MGGSVIAIALHTSDELMLRKVRMGCIPQRAAFNGSVYCNRVADEHKC